jgi:hypothetical protein
VLTVRWTDAIAKVRDAAAAELGAAWNRASFQAQATRIEEQLANSRLREALDGAQQLLQRARAVGEEAYSGAGYDIAMACLLLASVVNAAGASEQALPLLDEARTRFETFEQNEPGRGAERMVSACLTEQSDSLLRLGRLDQAAAAYEENPSGNRMRSAVRPCGPAVDDLGHPSLASRHRDGRREGRRRRRG